VEWKITTATMDLEVQVPRYAAKADDNQPEIVKAFRSLGATVQHLHMVGKGCPDILVGYRGVNLLVEIKDGSKPPSQRKLTPDEVAFFESWKGQVSIVETVNDVTALLASIDL
jgi:hypothetical protein